MPSFWWTGAPSCGVFAIALCWMYKQHECTSTEGIRKHTKWTPTLCWSSWIGVLFPFFRVWLGFFIMSLMWMHTSMVMAPTCPFAVSSCLRFAVKGSGEVPWSVGGAACWNGVRAIQWTVNCYLVTAFALVLRDQFAFKPKWVTKMRFVSWLTDSCHLIKNNMSKYIAWNRRYISSCLLMASWVLLGRVSCCLPWSEQRYSGEWGNVCMEVIHVQTVFERLSCTNTTWGMHNKQKIMIWRAECADCQRMTQQRNFGGRFSRPLWWSECCMTC